MKEPKYKILCKIFGHKWQVLTKAEVLKMQPGWDEVPTWLEFMDICIRCDIHRLQTKSMSIHGLIKERNE